MLSYKICVWNIIYIDVTEPGRVLHTKVFICKTVLNCLRII